MAQDKRQAPFTRAEFAALWASDMPTRDIALRAGRSATNVQEWAKRFGLPRRPLSSNPCAAQQLLVSDEQFVEMWNRGDAVEEMKKTCGVSRSAIDRTVKRLGLKKRTQFNDERLPPIADEFKRLWMDRGTTTKAMARRFNVHRNTISDWAKVLCLPPKPLQLANVQYVEGPLPGDPSPEEIAERAAECRARRELAKAQSEW